MLARLVTRFPRRVLTASVVLLLLLGVFAVQAMEALSLNRYEAPGSESVAARDELGAQFGTSTPNVAILITAQQGDVNGAEVARIGEQVTKALASYPGVGDAWSYWSELAPDSLASGDLRHALVLAWVPGDADHVRGEVLPGIESEIVQAIDSSAVQVQLGGADEVFRTVATQARADFLLAEIIIIPLVLLLLWAVYRRFRLALITIGVGLFSVVGTLAILRLISELTDVSTFASNIALVMGIGLGVDYGLFMTYRFREELAAGRPVPEAVETAVRNAGRTIAFSGITVAASLAVLFVFPFPFLSSFAYAGIAVVITAMFGSVVLLPAALRILGTRAARRTPERPVDERSHWHRMAALVMRRPLISGAAALAVLLVLGAPALGINFGSPDDRLLPSSQPVRSMYDTIRAEFTAEDADALYVVAERATDSEVAEHAAALSLIDGVQRVDTASGAFEHGVRVGDAGPFGADRFRDGEATWLAVLPTTERLTADPIGLVAEVRSEVATLDASVGGYPAELADYRAGVVERLPLVGGLILLVTLIVLFLMTGSVVAPIKASILNLLSLSVMFGVLVWGFQNGGLAPLLGFTPTGAIEPSVVLLMFCVAYGLSMDYEVFLLARIKEDYDRTGDVTGSVPRGVARSAPLVTAAALILAVSFAVYATSEVTFLQQLGIGMAVAVIIDATIIRGVLLPSFMRLAGRANWWAPEPLRRWHARFGWREAPVTQPAAEAAAAA